MAEKKKSVHVFKGEVHHSGRKFKKGEACPDELVDAMKSLGAVAEWQEPIRPIEGMQVGVKTPEKGSVPPVQS